MERTLAAIRTGARAQATVVAGWLNRLSGGRITPAAVTLFGFGMHVPIAWLIAIGENYWAAGLLVIFGLFDILDGALARLQGTSSARGMLLDASTDRMKEVLLYSGAGYALAIGSQPTWAAWAAAAVGASVCVSYVKAKGEAAVASATTKIPHATLNRMFADGLMTFEVRMAVLVIGLISGQLGWAVVFIAVTSSITAVSRLVRISRQLA